MQFVGTVWYVCMYVLELVRVLEAMLSSVRISGVWKVCSLLARTGMYVCMY